MSTEVASPRRSRKRRVILIIVTVFVAVGTFVAIWIGVRGSMARSELLDSVPLAHRIQTAAIEGKASTASADVTQLQTKSARAMELTSDPVWRAAEVIPGIGPNLVAVRESAALVHEVAVSGIPPLITLANTVNAHQLVPHDGTFDLGLFTKAAPSLAVAKDALDRARTHALAIDAEGTIEPVQSAVTSLVTLVDTTASTVDGISTAATLLPTMLGADGPRSYLLLSLNSAELRTPGGIPGAIAVIHANNGVLSLDQRTSATALGRAKAPVLPLSDAEMALYDERLGTYMQNVVSTPDFKRSGELAQAMWKLKTGMTVDGIVAIDPVALGYILRATGPVDVGSGVTLTSDNAVSFLLSTVYAQIPDTTAQDEFFAGTTRSIFAVLTKGSLDAPKLVEALAQSASENRIHIWSANADEEKVLSTSTLAGALPKSTAKTTAFGVYLNDATGAKMDVYLRNAITISSAICRADNRPNYKVGVKLTLDAPLDSATVLPSYVTGRYAFGVEPGRVRTNVYVYAPPGAAPFSVKVNGKELAFASATLDGHPVVGSVVEMGPSETVSIVFQFVGKAGDARELSLQHTPMTSTVPTSLNGKVDCSNL
ncbi:MAG TPA: DUF4012 domain-containing protein [Pseudolysinimonas sp.]|nr:DUF4012 domain-containing protein [Pseudolysinimonas sp.]